MMIIETQRRLAQVFTSEQASILAEVIEQSYRDLVKIGDFNELKAIVRELAEQQKQTSAEVKELAEQQKQTSAEVKTLSAEMKELAEQQKQTSAEVKSLSTEVKVLSIEMQKFSVGMQELAEQQKQTSAEVKELVDQQKKVWTVIESLIQEDKSIRHELGKTRQEVGGLSTTVGYRLEDESYKALPHLLKQDFDLQVVGKIKRGYWPNHEGQPLEINILGKAVQGDKEFLLIGEAKSQLSKKYVDEFIRRKLKQIATPLEVFPILVTYMVGSPEVEDYVRKKEIALYYSYDF